MLPRICTQISNPQNLNPAFKNTYPESLNLVTKVGSERQGVSARCKAFGQVAVHQVQAKICEDSFELNTPGSAL